MKSNEALLLGFGGLLAFMFYSKVRAAQTLVFYPGRINGFNINYGSPTIDLTLIAQNTSSSGFTLQSLAAQVLSDGTMIGNVSSFVPVQINANSQAQIPVRLTLFPITLVNEIVSALTNGHLSRAIKITGFANAGFVRAPVDVEFKVGS